MAKFQTTIAMMVFCGGDEWCWCRCMCRCGEEDEDDDDDDDSGGNNGMR